MCIEELKQQGNFFGNGFPFKVKMVFCNTEKYIRVFPCHGTFNFIFFQSSESAFVNYLGAQRSKTRHLERLGRSARAKGKINQHLIRLVIGFLQIKADTVFEINLDNSKVKDLFCPDNPALFFRFWEKREDHRFLLSRSRYLHLIASVVICKYLTEWILIRLCQFCIAG